MRTADSTLLQAWIEHRDAQAFGEIVRRYAGLVYGSSLRILASPPDAEDVSQECFLALAGAEDPAPRSLPCWLHAVATRQACKRIRGDRNRRIREGAHAEGETKQSEPVWGDISSYVDEAIEELPESLRRVVTAHFLLQRTHRSIARELGMTRQAVSYRIAQGVEQIRRSLRRRGISASAALLGALLGAQACVAAPTSLSGSLGRLAIAGTPGQAALPFRTTFAPNVPMLISLATLVVVGAGIFILRPTETFDTTPGAVTNESQVAVVEVITSLPEPAPMEENFPEPDLLTASISDVSMIEEPSGERVVNRTISGRVYDLNTTLPIADVTVIAEHKSERRLPSGLSVKTIHVQTSETDMGGIFRITRLMPRQYMLQVRTEWGEVAVERKEVDLRFSDEIIGVDLGISIPPAEGARIEGFVTHGGERMSGAMVAITYDLIRKEGSQEIIKRSVEAPRGDVNGAYVITKMQEGTVSMKVAYSTSDPPVITEFVDTMRDGRDVHVTSSGSIARICQFVDLVAGETYEIDFDFPASANGGIVGRIQPYPEVDRGIVRAFMDNRDGVSVEWTAPVTPEGYYLLSELPAGDFEVIVETGKSQVAFLAPDGSLRGVSGQNEVVRLSAGLWTYQDRSIYPIAIFVAKGEFPARKYFTSYHEAVIEIGGHISLDGDFRSDLVTVDSGMISRLDFDFDESISQ